LRRRLCAARVVGFRLDRGVSQLPGACGSVRRSPVLRRDEFRVRGSVGVLVRSVSAASAQVAQTMNGVPVQVVPSFPEPGVPLISIAPGTPSLFPGDADPSGSGAGSGSGNDGTAGGAAAVTATGAGSNGSAGGFVAASYSQYLGQVVGNGQCAVLVEAADPSVGLTATWTQGAAVQGNTSLQPGTIIATFDAGGEYAGATDGS